MHILDDNALDKLLELEASVWGDDVYLDYQEEIKERFELFRATYRRVIEEHPEYAQHDFPFRLDDTNDDSVIYGYSGFNRYAVLFTGEIWYIREFCAGLGIEKAVELGFRVDGPTGLKVNEN